MTDFVCSLAGINIGVDCVFESTRKFCADYITDDLEALHISVNQSDIDAERFTCAESDGNMQRFSDSYYETLALHRKIVTSLLKRDILLFHGSAIEVKGEAYIFTARSGTGKTTHTRLWKKLCGDSVVIINGDKPLLRFEDDRISVCGTPWNGKEHYGTNKIVPLKAVCVPERNAENLIRRIDMTEALPFLFQQTYIPKDQEGIKKP